MNPYVFLGLIALGYKLTKHLKNEIQKEQLVVPKICPQCGATFSDINAQGRIGCAMCYIIFEEELTPHIQKCQHSLTHIGKSPKEKQSIFENHECQ